MIPAHRDYLVLATKYTMAMTRGTDPNAGGNHRKNLVQTVEGCLKRMKTDYIDLLWIHAWDFLTPVDEVMRALDDLVRAGKILYVGISDAPAWVVAQCNTMAELCRWTPFCALQIEYSLVERTPERDLLPMARVFDLAVTPWSPLGGGVLTGKYLKKAEDEARRMGADSGKLSERNMAIAREVVAVAEEVGKSPAAVALAWLRAQNNQIIPIVGARRVDQLKDNLTCLDFKLSCEQLQRLDDVSRIELGFPHDFLNHTSKDTVYGGLRERLVDHRDRRLGTGGRVVGC